MLHLVFGISMIMAFSAILWLSQDCGQCRKQYHRSFARKFFDLPAQQEAYLPNFGNEKLEIYQPNRRLVCPFTFQVHFTCPNTSHRFFKLYCLNLLWRCHFGSGLVLVCYFLCTFQCNILPNSTLVLTFITFFLQMPVFEYIYWPWCMTSCLALDILPLSCLYPPSP